MNAAWKTADAEAHEAKADALGHAADALRDCEGALSQLAWNQAYIMLITLEHERDGHEQAAKLGRVA